MTKIHKRLYDTSGRPVISNCGTTPKKVSQFLDNHLKPVMENVLPCIRDTGHFLEKSEGAGEIPENSLFVSTDVVGLCPSISLKACLSVFKEAHNKNNVQKILIETSAWNYNTYKNNM